VLNISNSKYVYVFDIKDKGNYVLANLSTSKKNPDGTYDHMYWKGARFVGNAFEPAKSLNDKDIIQINNGGVTNRYDKSENKLYVNVVVFDFEKMKEDE